MRVYIEVCIHRNINMEYVWNVIYGIYVWNIGFHIYIWCFSLFFVEYTWTMYGICIYIYVYIAPYFSIYWFGKPRLSARNLGFFL